jgi:hypothetical protein
MSRLSKGSRRLVHWRVLSLSSLTVIFLILLASLTIRIYKGDTTWLISTSNAKPAYMCTAHRILLGNMGHQGSYSEDDLQCRSRGWNCRGSRWKNEHEAKMIVSHVAHCWICSSSVNPCCLCRPLTLRAQVAAGYIVKV